jgi:beta-barrel assembly-enhancing protease
VAVKNSYHCALFVYKTPLHNLFPMKNLLFIAFFSLFVSTKPAQAQDILSALVPLSHDVSLGKQVSTQIEKDPKVKILNEKDYPAAYQYLQNITKNIIESGQVKNAKNFPWVVKIIHDDKTLNAFCTPGGFIYVYTGLIKFLDSEDHLAGVMGHEIAHADQRHSTKQMLENQGIQMVSEMVLGKNQNAIANIAKNLLALKFSRTDETDADKASVNYLCATMYQADGAAGFFDKLQQQGKAGSTPTFLSTHPSPANRVTNIRTDAARRQCKSQTVRRANTYPDFKNSLPK